MGYSITTERYHLVEWHTWNYDTKKAGDIVANELFDLQEDQYENENIYDQANYGLKNDLVNQLHAGWRKAVPKIP